MNLFKVTISMPVNAGTYYVVAGGFDEAAAMAMAADQKNNGHNGGVDQIEVIGSFGGEDETLLLNDEAASFLQP